MHDGRPRPVPSPRIECPWCGEPVEFDPGASVLDCPACAIRAEVTGGPASDPRATARPHAA